MWIILLTGRLSFNRLRVRHSSGVVHFFGKELNLDSWFDLDANWVADVSTVPSDQMYTAQQFQSENISREVELSSSRFREEMMEHVRRQHQVVFVFRRVQSASGGQVPLTDSMGVDAMALVFLREKRDEGVSVEDSYGKLVDVRSKEDLRRWIFLSISVMKKLFP